MANPVGLLLVYILISNGRHLTSGKECKFEHKYVCDIQDCNCRYVSQNGVSISSFYRRFIAMFSQDSGEGQVCDKCEVFCSKEKHINCQHGVCDKDKGCICRDCWSGETCSKYHNSEPEFKHSLYVAEIKEGKNIGEEILTVSAVDSDMETCVDKSNCPCGRVKYSIKKGNEDGLFYINPDDGVVSVARELYVTDQYHPISLTIAAENEGDLSSFEEKGSDKSLVTVAITVVENDEVASRQRRSLHHRARRSVTPYDSLEITFAPNTNETFFAAGCTINYRLDLAHNSSASPKNLSNMDVQLYSKSLELNDVRVNISNVKSIPSLTRPNPNAVNFSIANPMNTNDRMEITFNGTVRAASDPLALLQVAFTMNATVQGPAQVTYGPKYSTEVFTTYPKTTMARTPQGDVPVESTLDYNINITLPFFNFTFVFEITTFVNDFRFLSIENVQVGDISSSVLPQHQNPTPVVYTGAEDNITSRVVVDFGKLLVTNRDQNMNTIKLSFSTKAYDHHLLANGSTHYLGVGAHSGDQMLWIGQDAITFSKDEPYLYAEIQAINKTNPTRYYINDVLRFSWSVKHANASYESAEDVKILFYFSKSVVKENNGAESGLTSGGSTVFSTAPDGTGRTLLTFTVTAGGGTLAKGNSLNGIIAVKVNGSVSPLADLNVEIQISYKTSKSQARPIRTYKPNPGYIAGVPSFNLSSSVPDRLVNIGKLVEITVKILISRMTLSGKLYVILPVKNSTACVRLVRHESFTNNAHGTNVQVTPDFTNAKPTFNSTSNDTSYYDRAEIDLGVIKNKALTDSALSSVDDNTVTMAFKVVLEDNNYVANGSSHKIGVGVKGSEDMVWISQMILIANLARDRRPRLQIEAYSNDSDNLVQGSVVEYNFTISHKDDSDAHAMDVKVVWMMPVHMKYLQINQKSDHQISVLRSQHNIVFKLSGKLDFGETPTVSFSVAIDPSSTIKKSGKNYAVTPVALSYKNKQQSVYYEPLIPISVEFTVPYQPSPTPPNAVDEYYNRGFLIDTSRSALYICSVSPQRNRPSCFWTETKGKTWRAVDVMVINIIGIDNGNKMVYGIGNNKLGYMKYIPNKGKWYSISSDQWEQAKSTLSQKDVVKIEDDHKNDGTPEANKTKNIENSEKWGANKIGVYHFVSSWELKALWNCCN